MIFFIFVTPNHIVTHSPPAGGVPACEAPAAKGKILAGGVVKRDSQPTSQADWHLFAEGGRGGQTTTKEISNHE